MSRLKVMSQISLFFFLVGPALVLGQSAQSRPTDTHAPRPAQAQDETFPTEDQIKLLVTQAERAFWIYENTLKGSGITVPNDQKLLSDARDVIEHIKTIPRYFNAPMGFLLVTDLDDASKNMALCAFQASMQASAEAMTGSHLDAANSKMHLAQSFLDASALLQTVGESAFNLYAQFLSANFHNGEQQGEALKQCMDTLQVCADTLKKSRATK